MVKEQKEYLINLAKDQVIDKADNFARIYSSGSQEEFHLACQQLLQAVKAHIHYKNETVGDPLTCRHVIISNKDWKGQWLPEGKSICNDCGKIDYMKNFTKYDF